MVSREIIEKAKEFHGHVCPFLVLGLRISEIAMEKLGLRKAGLAETVEEEVIAIVEVNNCMVDGVQIATGCTLGNNSLIYLDLGKNAVTLIKRDSKKGVRIYIDSEKLRSKYFPQEALELFRKVVVERSGSREDIEKLSKLWEEIGYRMADLPKDEFIIQEVEVFEDIERAPIYPSVRCSRCGELVMEPKAVKINSETLCPVCAGAEFNAVIGRGIVKLRRIPYKRIV
jgi:formylmethanofuran dehydrogenase subunit E